MGNITRSFSIDVIGVTTYVIFRWRKVTDPGVEINRRVFGPSPSVTNNFSITDLDAVTYYFDTYVSSDGTALTTLYATYTMDVKNSLITNERRFYTVDSGIGNAPAAGAKSLIDSNLDNKTVTGVFQRAFGYLVPTDEWVRTAGGVDLVGDLQFNQYDVYMVEITYTTDATSSSGGVLGLFGGIKVITSDVTLDSSFIRKRIKLNGTGNRLVVTMDAIGNIPDGSYFYFVDNDSGTQFQTKIISSDASFKWAGNTTAEIWVGKGEFLWFEKQGSNFEVVQAHPGLTSVYEKFSGNCLAYLNSLAEDNSLYDADDYPRPWWFLNNKLNPTLVITDNTLDAGGYVRPANRQGQFIISPAKRKFRMPDTRDLTEKGMLRFDQMGWNSDAGRAYDYPGGFQDEMIGPHSHEQQTFSANGGGTPPRKKPVGYTDVLDGLKPSGYFTVNNTGVKNIVKNTGVIHFTRI